ncbi:nitroreductase family protein [Fulvivirga sediminis]|uniref:Nitroreductase family protein n=1 Tax=Fulvivirga sediminis TaxID=2803949 RepID=A0A937F2W5_9BACT|nr:nitroreductase family protein [Fulvivirga sediminis]MBL3655322.1 nitroreductase family protein [Fulvivirga sediminis]
MTLVENLNWRYAAKKMNGKSIPKEKLDYILEASRLAPSSSGLQQYKIIVVSDKALLEKIQMVAYNQSQVGDCSHVLIWAAWDGYTDERVTEVFNEMMDERDLPHSTMDRYKQTIMARFNALGQEYQAHHAAKQAYISLGLAVAAAAEQKVDATPMEGFSEETLDKLLKLEGTGFKSVVMLPLGYRDAENDWAVNMKKFRIPQERFITVMTNEDTDFDVEPIGDLDGILDPEKQ